MSTTSLPPQTPATDTSTNTSTVTVDSTVGPSEARRNRFALARRGNGFSRPTLRPGGRSTLKVQGVEGWRALACLLVLVYHVWQNMDVANDGIGPAANNAFVYDLFINVDLVTDLFFVLSGMLLFLPFASAALAPGDAATPHPRVFLFRRFLRIYPLYFVLVLIAWGSRNFGAFTAQWRDLIEHLFLVQSLDSERIFYTIGPAWTLSIEAMFYVALALLGRPFVNWMRLAPANSARLMRGLFALFLVAAASLVYKANVELVWQRPVTDWAWRYGPLAKADDFAIGMALALIVAYLGARRLHTAAFVPLAASGVGLLALAMYRLGVNHDVTFPIYRHTIAAVGWALFLTAFMLIRSEAPARAVDNAVLVRLGVYSYAVYLAHEPVLLGMQQLGLFSKDPGLFWVNLTAVLMMTVLAAVALNRFIEEPWTDAAALQRKTGGRRDLYPHLSQRSAGARSYEPSTLPASEHPLRSAVTARLAARAPAEATAHSTSRQPADS